MCLEPGVLYLKNAQKISVPCRKCELCRDNKITDWVGRCIAESKTAAHCRSITLTYGRDEHGNSDHHRAAVLTYSDVQKYFKLLRRHGYPCRYFAVGEYGAEKGRAHWHAIVFFQNDVPKHILAPRREGREDDTPFRFMERHWPHGWSFWEDVSPRSIRYVCKYINKGMGDAERQGHVALSKKPPLGHDYFQQLAIRYVEQGIAPQDPYYWFGDCLNRDGEPVKFYLQGVSLDNFCRAFVLNWWRVHNRHPPISPLIEAFTDRMASVDRPLLAEVMPKQINPFYLSPGEAKSYHGEGGQTWRRENETSRTTSERSTKYPGLSKGGHGYINSRDGS
ncbi:replication initiation protein [Tortoise microvirus 82]|nr:replication initiation protein [Tortoise microvirus 82]